MPESGKGGSDGGAAPPAAAKAEADGKVSRAGSVANEQVRAFEPAAPTTPLSRQHLLHHHARLSKPGGPRTTPPPPPNQTATEADGVAGAELNLKRAKTALGQRQKEMDAADKALEAARDELAEAKATQAAAAKVPGSSPGKAEAAAGKAGGSGKGASPAKAASGGGAAPMDEDEPKWELPVELQGEFK
jgi:hypothetical protein